MPRPPDGPKVDESKFSAALRVEGLLYAINGDNYVVHPIPNMAYGDILNIVCCCEKNIHYMNTRSMGERIAYHNPCAYCDTYQVGNTIGLGLSAWEWKFKYVPSDSCSNGFCFAVCPCLCCSGRKLEASIDNMDTGEQVLHCPYMDIFNQLLPYMDTGEQV